MPKNKLKKQVFGVLDDYGLLQDAKHGRWDKVTRDRFFHRFLLIAERYRLGVIK